MIFFSTAGRLAVVRASCLFACLLLSLAVGSLSAAEQGAHLFVLSGQSNMAGVSAHKSFTPIGRRRPGYDQVIVVQDAKGGKSIRHWDKQFTRLVPQNQLTTAKV